VGQRRLRVPAGGLPGHGQPEQRDLYGYLHDQTLRLLNAGYTGIEIAELLQLPPALETAWHTRTTGISASPPNS
jgi:alkyl sulfatase BDS1-like metallo-beta-lactamase superfamily hydrolase